MDNHAFFHNLENIPFDDEVEGIIDSFLALGFTYEGPAEFPLETIYYFSGNKLKFSLVLDFVKEEPSIYAEDSKTIEALKQFVDFSE